MPKYVGIDLGTTYTQAALCQTAPWTVDKSDITMIRFTGRREPGRFPSMVYYPSPGEPPVAGEQAEDELEYHPNQVLRESKSRLALEAMMEMKVAYPDGAEKKYAAWKVSSIILDQAIQAMSAQDNIPIDWTEIQACAITYPASFPRNALRHTRQAAERIPVLQELRRKGKDRLSFLPEPVAAFLGVLNREGPCPFSTGDVILVVDIGAGTTDTTVVRIGEEKGRYPDVSILEVGEHVLQGGNDYDRVIAEYLCRQLWPEPLDDTALHLADRKDVQSAMNRFWYSMILTAREIKEGISSEADTDLEVDLRDLKYFRERYLKSLRDVMGIPERTTVRLRSMEFDRVLSGLMGNPIGNTLFAGLKRLEERYMNGEHKALEPTGILLAGGGAQVNAVRKMLQERYPDAPIHKPRNPHYLIAQGAAAFAALPEEERDLWRWPINKDVYLKVEDQKNKRVIWDKIWSRERPEDEYDYTMPKSSERLEIILGAGFYDMEHNIDRITPQKPRTLSFHRQVRKQEPVKLRTWVDTLSARPYMKILLQEYGAWREACPDISLEVDIE